MAYASVNGLQLYREIHGSGQPLVLLHDGLLAIDLDFGVTRRPSEVPALITPFPGAR